MSTSLTVSVPLLLKPALVSARLSESGPSVITGASFTGLKVMLITWSVVPPRSSVTVMVKESVPNQFESKGI